MANEERNKAETSEDNCAETVRPIAKHITEAEHDWLIDEEARKGFPKLGGSYAIGDKCNMQTIREALISAESILRYTPDFTTNVRGTRPMTTTRKSLAMVRAALATIPQANETK
jgi:hypothetical protein